MVSMNFGTMMTEKVSIYLGLYLTPQQFCSKHSYAIQAGQANQIKDIRRTSELFTGELSIRYIF